MKMVNQMKYKIRKGVQLVECCGEYLLISTLEAREYCPYIMSLNEASAYLWGLLSKQTELTDVVKEVANQYEISLELASKTIFEFIESLKENGYILMKEGADKKC